jgi:hypothetical protein
MKGQQFLAMVLAVGDLAFVLTVATDTSSKAKHAQRNRLEEPALIPSNKVNDHDNEHFLPDLHHHL